MREVKLMDIPFFCQIFAQQFAKDSSDTSTNMREKCRALTATPEERVILWRSYIENTGGSQRLQENSMEGFTSVSTNEDKVNFADVWF